MRQATLLQKAKVPLIWKNLMRDRCKCLLQVEGNNITGTTLINVQRSPSISASGFSQLKSSHGWVQGPKAIRAV